MPVVGWDVALVGSPPCVLPVVVPVVLSVVFPAEFPAVFPDPVALESVADAPPVASVSFMAAGSGPQAPSRPRVARDGIK
jgi:hypothetical protein